MKEKSKEKLKEKQVIQNNLNKKEKCTASFQYCYVFINSDKYCNRVSCSTILYSVQYSVQYEEKIISH